jgi:hypothetical protein
MPRWHVERVARLEDLFMVAVPDGEAPRRDIAPVRARAAVARNPSSTGVRSQSSRIEVKMTS